MFVVVKLKKVREKKRANKNPYGVFVWGASKQNKNPQSDHSSQQSTKTETHRVSRKKPIILTHPKLW